MQENDNYSQFLRNHGRPMSEINPGSNEVALSCEDAKKATEILRKESVPILGGDIVSEQNGSLIYAHQFWGSEYISLNWYCRREQDEELEYYARRSHDLAEDHIENARRVAAKLGQECFVVLVT